MPRRATPRTLQTSEPEWRMVPLPPPPPLALETVLILPHPPPSPSCRLSYLLDSEGAHVNIPELMTAALKKQLDGYDGVQAVSCFPPPGVLLRVVCSALQRALFEAHCMQSPVPCSSTRTPCVSVRGRAAQERGRGGGRAVPQGHLQVPRREQACPSITCPS